MIFICIFRIVPNYDLAPDLSQVDILRVVVKENFTEALLDRLVADIVGISDSFYTVHAHRINRSRSQKTSPSKTLPRIPSVLLASVTESPTRTRGRTVGSRNTRWKEFRRSLAPIPSHVKGHAHKATGACVVYGVVVVREGRTCSGEGSIVSHVSCKLLYCTVRGDSTEFLVRAGSTVRSQRYPA